MASIFLAIGHGISTNGNWDCGCTDGAYTEADLMKPIVGVAVGVLRANGVDVYTDFPENDMNISACVALANQVGVDVYVSLHCDYNQAPSGTLPIVHPSSSGGDRLQACINASVMLRTGLGCRGVLKRDDWEVTDTQMPACIFETGSIRADINKLLEFETYGRAVAYGILDYFGMAYNGNTPAPAPTPTPAPPAPAAPNNPYGFGSVYTSTYYLEYGDGPDANITQMQKDCNFCGYQGQNGQLAEDGLYGSECKYACECVQSYHGLYIDGIYGVDTDIALMTEVAQIQEALKKHGYDVAVDGGVGAATLAATKDFQSKNGLVSDAIVGDATSAALGI